MNTSYVPMVLAGAGIVLIVVSFVWPSMVSNESIWSRQQAQEHADLAANVHASQHPRSQDSDTHDDDSSAAVKQRHERSAAELKAAIAYPGKTAAYFRWAGIACSLLAVAAYRLRGRDYSS